MAAPARHERAFRTLAAPVSRVLLKTHVVVDEIGKELDGRLKWE